MKENCWLCGKESHRGIVDCPLWEDAKKLTIARLENMPDNMLVSIG